MNYRPETVFVGGVNPFMNVVERNAGRRSGITSHTIGKEKREKITAFLRGTTQWVTLEEIARETGYKDNITIWNAISRLLTEGTVVVEQGMRPNGKRAPYKLYKLKDTFNDTDE